MRFLFAALFFFAASCSNREDADMDSPTHTDTNYTRTDLSSPAKDSLHVSGLYSNARFKNVIVNKIGPDSYKLTGEGQIFEASFNWVVEDGHNELLSGHTTTDAGAPAWGKFEFTVAVPKPRANSVLHLILFEASPEDGRRTHELPLVLQ